MWHRPNGTTDIKSGGGDTSVGGSISVAPTKKVSIISSQMASPHGQWIRKPQGDAAVIFVHGILSSSQTCWSTADVYWPDLLTKEPALSAVGVYAFSYRADAFSGNYSIGDAVESMKLHLDLDHLLQLKKLVFVCHSMGGILARQFLVTRQAAVREAKIRIGLFLIASPSLGSDYANWLRAIAKAAGNSQAQTLRFDDDNTWLNDLDRNFINLKESKLLEIEGRELVEDEFIALPWLVRRQVVRQFSAARYFGESAKIPHSNHFTIATPSGPDSLQHRILVRFIGDFLKESDSQSGPVADSLNSTKIAGGKVSFLSPSAETVTRAIGEGETVRIGRAPINGIVFDHEKVSTVHAEIAQRLGSLIITDLGSKNGVFVNRRRIRQSCVLASGDVVHLSRHGPQIAVIEGSIRATETDQTTESE
jgi:pSer/pThr/pTyr-binding forkhead associated (FHA) protein